MFKKVLIANRGEIALRVLRACKELGLSTVAVHAAADVTGADAIHPGYGFLSENAEFAELVTKMGLRFIGPRPEMIRLMGNRVAAREAMEKAGLPLLPGARGKLKDAEEAQRIADEIGYPVILKAAAGGGGRGMKICRDGAQVKALFETASNEALSAFGDGSMYLERYVEMPRHIELQMVGDEHGDIIHLGERECSVQRRHQKLIEEAPSPAVTPALRREMGEVALSAMRKIAYNNVGTIEFLMDEKGRYYFMEMNTRIQVEHPVTEQVYGLDLLRLQIKLAAGDKLD